MSIEIKFDSISDNIPPEYLIINTKPKLFDIRKTKVQKKWTREEDTLLIELARKYNYKNWKGISSNFEDKTSLQCFSRYKRIRPGIIKGSWTRDEDDKIMELVGKYGKSWSKISKVLVSRNGKQIRDRFINILDPNIKKGKFSHEEDVKLVSLYKKLGPRWATISKFFDNRTADMIKNRFHSSIKKNMNFYEDLELDYPIKYSKTISTAKSSRINSFENYNNIEDCKNNLKSEEENSRKDFEDLKTENPINLNFLQNADTPPTTTQTPQSPTWQIEDYFII